MYNVSINSFTQNRKLKQALSNSRVFCVLSLLCYFSFPVFASAATLSIDPNHGNFGPGDMFVVTVRIDTDKEECINASDVDMTFPKDLLKVTAVSKGESLITLWTDGPLIENEKGRVSWSGGIPGGYCGRVLGDPGKTNILGKVVFSVINIKPTDSETPMQISFGSSTKVLLNDGFGTAAPLVLGNAMLTRTVHSGGVKNEWLDIVKGDTTPPDQFDVSVHHDQNAFDGKYFIVFSTVDKQSGVDHFEVIEDDPSRLGFVRGGNDRAHPQAAVSPYVLRDQSLKSRVIVRAIDNAGNIEEIILPPTNGVFSVNAVTTTGSMFTKYQEIWWSLLALLFIAITGSLYLHHKKTGEQKEVPPEALTHEEPPETN